MSKELEALKNIVNEISNYKLRGLGDENWLGIQDVMRDIDVLEKALTPPTAEELCEELGEYYEVKVMFESNEFYYKDRYSNSNVGIVGLRTKKVKEKVVKNCVDFYPELPPTLIKRIAQFYENEVVE